MRADVASPSYGRSEAQRALATIVRVCLFGSLTLAVVVPHSFQLVEVVAFVTTSLFCAVLIRRDAWLDRVMLTYGMGCVVTAVYVWVGYGNGAPSAAITQTLFVYIVSPLMWIVMSAALFQYVGITRVVQWLVWLTWAAVASVAAFFYLYLAFGQKAVAFLISDPTINLQSGYVGATMLVYGSLIFLVGSLFAFPDIVRRKSARLLLPAFVIVAVLSSGRSALMLSIPVGVVVGILLRGRMRQASDGKRRKSLLAPAVLLAVIMILVIVVIDTMFVSVDLSVIVGEFWRELATGGGSERTGQAAALWEGTLASNGLGVGHGVGVAYLRNADFPWRYEVMPLATLLRVGVIGAMVYASTFAIYGFEFSRRMIAKDLTGEDVYMMGGFVCVALAVATNPYIESFVFQWMYFLPVMSLLIRPVTREAGA